MCTQANSLFSAIIQKQLSVRKYLQARTRMLTQRNGKGLCSISPVTHGCCLSCVSVFSLLSLCRAEKSVHILRSRILLRNELAIFNSRLHIAILFLNFSLFKHPLFFSDPRPWIPRVVKTLLPHLQKVSLCIIVFCCSTIRMAMFN